MTVLIFKTDNSVPTELVSPDGTVLTSESTAEGLQWHHESGYDMITISKPVSGKWKAKAEIDPDNRVLVVTNLKLKSNKFTHNFLKGDIITIYSDLEEDNKIIKKQEFLKLVTFNLKINGADNAYKLNDNGSIPDAKPQDGIFSSIIETAGLGESNDVLIEAKGATFNRQLRHSFKVFKSPFTLNVEEPVDGQPFNFSVTIKPYVFVKDSVNIHIELPDGKILTAKADVNQRWKTSIPANYQGNNIQVSLEGKRYSQSGPYQYSESYGLPSITKEDVVKEEVVIEEPEKVMEKPPIVLKKHVAVKEEPAPPKEITPPPPPVTEEKIAEPPVKKEDQPIAKTEALTPEPEQNENWFIVFLIVLVGNVILIAGAYYGYLFWKKKRNKVLAEDNAVLEEDDSDTGTDNQAQPPEDGSEGDDKIPSTAEASIANDSITDEPEANVEAASEQHKDADPLMSDEDEDILKQQLETEEESNEPPAAESTSEAEDAVTEPSSDEEQQTPVDETPEETPVPEAIEEPDEVATAPDTKDDGVDSPILDEDEDILKQQLENEDKPDETPDAETLDDAVAITEPKEPVSATSTEETEEVSDIEPSSELDEATNTESTSEPQDNPADTVAESPEEETIELDSPEVTNESEVAESPAERDESPESESDIEIETASDELQDSLDDEAILSDLDFEIDSMDESDERELDDSQKTEPAKDAK